MEALKYQVGGNHYRKRAIQPIEYILANNLNFPEGSIVKYVTRWRDKGGIKDLEKIIQYAKFMIEDELKRQQPTMAVEPVETPVIRSGIDFPS